MTPPSWLYWPDSGSGGGDGGVTVIDTFTSAPGAWSSSLEWYNNLHLSGAAWASSGTLTESTYGIAVDSGSRVDREASASQGNIRLGTFSTEPSGVKIRVRQVGQGDSDWRESDVWVDGTTGDARWQWSIGTPTLAEFQPGGTWGWQDNTAFELQLYTD